MGLTAPRLACRLGIHRWAADHVGTRRCIRVGCFATKVAADDLSLMVDHANDPVGDYWVTCTRHDGKILYEGPVPIPDGLDALSPADREARRFNHYEFFPVELTETIDED